jgi:anti-sigma factor RsiW
MTDDEAEALLGAYALDAVSGQERRQVEAHLTSCPRCQAELTAHREIAAMMAAGLSDEVPARVWERVASSTFSSHPDEAAGLPPPPLGPLSAPDKRERPELVAVARRGRALAWSLGTAAAVAAIILASLFSVQVGQLRLRLQSLEQEVASASLAEAAAIAAAGPHVTVTLAEAGGARAATVVVAPKGLAYWVSSSLAKLPTSETYQLWGLVDGRPVSLGLLGPDPRHAGLFRVEAGTAKLMVTAEPAGGVPLPTTAVLAVGTVPAAAVKKD